MNADPASERLRAAFRAGQAGAEPTAACPNPEKIFDAVRGDLPSEQTLLLIDHSVTCKSCALAFRLARELLAEAEPAPIALAPRRAARWPLAMVAGLAAAAAIFLVARTESPQIYRADSVALTSLLKNDPLPREQFILRWSPLGPGTRYSVNVATPDLNVLFTRGGLNEAEVQVPAAALTKLPQGSQVVWRVTALLADGRRIESTAFITAVR